MTDRLGHVDAAGFVAAEYGITRGQVPNPRKCRTHGYPQLSRCYQHPHWNVCVTRRQFGTWFVAYPPDGGTDERIFTTLHEAVEYAYGRIWDDGGDRWLREEVAR